MGTIRHWIACAYALCYLVTEALGQGISVVAYPPADLYEASLGSLSIIGWGATGPVDSGDYSVDFGQVVVGDFRSFQGTPSTSSTMTLAAMQIRRVKLLCTLTSAPVNGV